MSDRIIVLQPDDAGDGETLSAGPGLAWVRGGDLAAHRQREAAARERGRTRPGSIYYPGAPPDEDDPWEWCRMCECWHPHGPCF